MNLTFLVELLSLLTQLPTQIEGRKYAEITFCAGGFCNFRGVMSWSYLWPSSKWAKLWASVTETSSLTGKHHLLLQLENIAVLGIRLAKCTGRHVLCTGHAFSRHPRSSCNIDKASRLRLHFRHVHSSKTGSSGSCHQIHGQKLEVTSSMTIIQNIHSTVPLRNI